jgi:hypothetical protein
MTMWRQKSDDEGKKVAKVRDGPKKSYYGEIGV